MLVKLKNKNNTKQLAIQAGVMSTLAAGHSFFNINSTKHAGYKQVKRERKEVESIFCQLGPRNVRKAYRMHGESFWRLQFYAELEYMQLF